MPLIANNQATLHVDARIEPLVPSTHRQNTRKSPFATVTATRLMVGTPVFTSMSRKKDEVHHHVQPLEYTHLLAHLTRPSGDAEYDGSADHVREMYRELSITGLSAIMGAHPSTYVDPALLAVSGYGVHLGGGGAAFNTGLGTIRLGDYVFLYVPTQRELDQNPMQKGTLWLVSEHYGGVNSVTRLFGFNEQQAYLVGQATETAKPGEYFHIIQHRGS